MSVERVFVREQPLARVHSRALAYSRVPTKEDGCALKFYTDFRNRIRRARARDAARALSRGGLYLLPEYRPARTGAGKVLATRKAKT